MGDIAEAETILRKKGIADAEKKSGRAAKEGVIASRIVEDAKTGILVEVNCETDFVSSNDQFQALAKDIALQISSMNPQYVSRDDVPAEVVEAKKAEFADDPDMADKEGDVLAASIAGKMDQWFQEVVLMEQDFIKADKTVEQVMTETTAELGETIKVARFARYMVGELAGDAPEDDE